jgi:hypothetical protein
MKRYFTHDLEKVPTPQASSRNLVPKGILEYDFDMMSSLDMAAVAALAERIYG